MEDRSSRSVRSSSRERSQPPVGIDNFLTRQATLRSKCSPAVNYFKTNNKATSLQACRQSAGGAVVLLECEHEPVEVYLPPVAVASLHFSERLALDKLPNLNVVSFCTSFQSLRHLVVSD